MGGGCDGRGDLREVQVHRLGVTGRQDQGCTLTLFRADRSEDVGGSSPLVTRCDGAGAALGQRRVILCFWPMQNFQVRSLDINFDQIRASVLMQLLIECCSSNHCLSDGCYITPN